MRAHYKRHGSRSNMMGEWPALLSKQQIGTLLALLSSTQSALAACYSINRTDANMRTGKWHCQPSASCQAPGKFVTALLNATLCDTLTMFNRFLTS